MPIRLPLLLAALALLLLVPAAARAADYVPDEVIVRYEEGTGGGVAAQVAAEAGTEPVQALPGGSEQLAIDDGDSVRETIAELREDPNVAYAVPNWRAHAAADATNDPGSRLQWNFFGTYGINVAEAWTLAQSLGAPGARGALVAVLDSGVAYERHGRFRRAPDLRRSTFVRPWDFIGKDRHPNDVFGHGTHVAGTIAQTTNNGVGTAGIAYNAKIMPLKVLDSNGEGDSVAIARAIRYAARYRADVINLSLEFPAEVRAAEIPDVLAALRYAHRRGAVVVAAAGNQADYAVAYPARAQSVIAVGATTVTGCQADYSNARRGPRRGGAGRRRRRPQHRQRVGRRPLRPGLDRQADHPGDLHPRGAPLRPAAHLRGHVHGEPARLLDRGTADRDEAARSQPEPGRGGAPHRGHGAADRPAGSLRRGPGGRGERSALGLPR